MWGRTHSSVPRGEAERAEAASAEQTGPEFYSCQPPELKRRTRYFCADAVLSFWYAALSVPLLRAIGSSVG